MATTRYDTARITSMMPLLLLFALIAGMVMPRQVEAQVAREFTPRFAINTPGDIVIVANNLVTCDPSDYGNDCDAVRAGDGGQNNDFKSPVYVDVDYDNSTFNSSRAELELPYGSNVVWAGLYWGARVRNIDQAPSPSKLYQVKFETPKTSGYMTINAQQEDDDGYSYGGFAEVTALVQAGGTGEYTVADLQVGLGDENRFGGWSLVVVYEDLNQPLRNLSVFDGFALVQNSTNNKRVTVNPNGFTTPLYGAFDTFIGAISYDGDRSEGGDIFDGDQFILDGTNVSNPLNPEIDVFNSSITNRGVSVTTRTPNYDNTLGFDADILDVSGIITNAQTEADVTVTTGGESISLHVLTFSSDIFEPDVMATKKIKDLNGGQVKPGDELEFTITVWNDGPDPANKVVLWDAIPSYTSYKWESLEVVSGPNAGPQSDAADYDVAEYNASKDQVFFRLGSSPGTSGGTLDYGESTTVKFRVTVDSDVTDGTTIFNQAIIKFRKATLGDFDIVTASDAARVTTGVGTDLVVEKWVDKDEAKAGETLTYTIKVSNAGPETADNITLTDVLPSATTFVSATAESGWDKDTPYVGESGTVTFTTGWMGDGDTATFTIVAKIAADAADGDILVNRAAVNSLTPDVNSSNNEDTAKTKAVVPDEIDIAVSKSVDRTEIEPGDTVTYTIEVSNLTWDTEAENVKVVDTLPDGAVFVSASDYGSYDSYKGEITWTDLWIAGNDSKTLTAQIKFEDEGKKKNCAEASIWDVDDPDLSNNKGCVDLWVASKKVDLEISKSVSDSNPEVDDTITFTINVHNQGPADATGVVVADYLPDGLWVVPGSATSNSNVSFDESSLTWTIWDLPAGTYNDIKLSFDAVVEQDGEFTNCAEVWDADQQDIDSQSGAEKGRAMTCPPGQYASLEDDEDFVEFWVAPSKVDLEISKRVSNAYPTVGHKVTYTINVHNQGPADATQVVVADYLPDGLWYVAGSATEDGNIDFDESSFTWTIWDLPAGTYNDIQLSFQAQVEEAGEFVNCAEVWDSDQLDIDSESGAVTGSALDCASAPYASLQDDEDFVQIWATPEEPQTDAICFVAADNDGVYGGSADVLSKLKADASVETIIGSTATEHLESIAFNPWTGKLFGADAGVLGTIDTKYGTFSPIGEFGYGTGYDRYGDYRTRGLLDVDGLAFDPHLGTLYGSVRKVGEPDLIFQIDPETGAFVEDAFGPGVDWVVILSTNGLDDVDDIAIDPVDGFMYAINNEDGDHSRLVRINKFTGQVIDVRQLPVANVEGLDFFGDGTLYATGGEGYESILIIDKESLNVEVVTTIGTDGNRDYEGVACLTSRPNETRVTLFSDLDGNAAMGAGELGMASQPVAVYRDMNANGQVDGSDVLLARIDTDRDGVASFNAAANGAFVFSAVNAPEQTAAVQIDGFGGLVERYVGMDDATATTADPTGDVPASFALLGNYPNPFNPTTSITFALPEAGQVRLAVYDMLGREMKVLVNGGLEAGTHTVHFDAGSLVSGIYLYRVAYSGQQLTGTMTLLK